MKKTALALSAALTLSAALAAFAGCSGQTFNVRDYARPAGSAEISELNEYAAYTTAQTIEGATDLSSLAGALFSVSTADGYRLYSAAAGSYVNSVHYTNISLIGPSVIALTSNMTSGVTYSYCAPTGSMLVENLTAPATFTTVSGYLRSGSPKTTFYKMTYRVDETAINETVRYFTYAAETVGGDRVWHEYSADDLRISGEPTSGDTLNMLESEASSLTSALRPATLNGYALAAVEAGSSTVCYVFRNGDQTGSFAINNGALLGYIGEYIYYYEMTEVDPGATGGYNVVYSMGIAELKYNVEYYRYNVLKDNVSRIESDYYILPDGSGLQPLYNYAEQDYDAAYTQAYLFRNGVATVTLDVASTGSTGSVLYSVVLNKDLKLEYDATQQPIDITTISQLADNRYGAHGVNGGYYLIDADMNVLAYADATDIAVYPSLGLITGSVNGNYLAIDFDGKVALGARYSSLTFYGGYAATSIDGGDTVIVSKAVPDGQSLTYLTDASETDTVTAQYGLIVRQTNATTAGAVYTYGGTRLIGFRTGESYRSVRYSNGYGYVTTNQNVYLFSADNQPIL